ncbi:hypothetical protein [Sagittula sp. S175]|uniref:hypothetical protein n=1 Tax=Sagittula sp. S175 TaxID=3415129 RepID=UPI003C7ED5A0
MRIAAMICLIALPLMAAPVLALTGRPTPTTDTILVVGPMDELGDILRRAGGRAIGPTRAPFALLAHADRHPEGFAQRLEIEGAWLVLDGTRAAQLCGV